MLTKCLIFALICVAAHAAEEDVLELTDQDFVSEIERHETTLVMFYAPWCGHCKRLKPEYAKAAELLKYNDPPIHLAKVDCTESGKETCNKYSVSGYPTLKIFSKGDLVADYNGPREAHGIVKYMKAQVGPASKEINNEKDLNALLESDDVVVIGYFEKDDSPLAASFHAVSKTLREKFQFGHTSNKDILEKQGLKDNIVLYRPKKMHNKFEPDSITYTGEGSISDIHNFIEKNYLGVAGIRTRDNANEFRDPMVIVYYNVDYVKNPKGTNYWRNRILKVAKNYPNFKYGISALDEFQHEVKEFGLDFVVGDKPVVISRYSKKKYVMKEEFSMETFEQFLKDLQNNVLEPYIRSEEIPDDNSGPVKVAVAKNFDEVVINNGKDTLVEFYAPWCGHCKKLAPIYTELGEKLANEDVEIVKFDAVANDVPPAYEVSGYPTLYWAPKDSKDEPVKYEGGRELDDFVKYIAKHATNPLKGYDRQGKPVKASSDEL